jgi:hypothetical protein
MFAIPLLTIGLLGADRPPKLDEARIAFQKRLHGEWNGQAACEGQLVFKSDGMFERTNFGPGQMTVFGTWDIKWDMTPPTLRIFQTTSDAEGFVPQTEVGKLTYPHEKSFVFTIQDNSNNQTKRKFLRPKK